MDIRGLAQQFIHFAANEQDKNGNRRTGPTISAYRRAMEGLIASTEAFNGGDLTTLPENFVETHWMQTQQSVAEKPIQMRVRVAALKLFTTWCFKNNIPCAPLQFPNIKTPPPKKKEEAVNDVTSLGDFMQMDPVPSANTNVVPMQTSHVTPAAPPQQPAKQQTAKPVGSGRPSNPLASMLPTGQYKLRVRRERELDDPVWVADFPAERVAVHGAIEPFLGREVAPRLALQGLTGDVTFLVSAIGPNGVEGERGRITVAITPPVPAMQSVPAPVVGAPVMGATSGQDIADQLAYHRRAQEELEDRIVKRVEQVAKPATQPQEERRVNNRDELDDLKRMMAQLAGSVQSLAERIEDRERDRDRDRDRFDGMSMMAAQTPPPAPAAPQLDLLAVIKEVASMTNKAAPPAPAAPPQPTLMEMFNMMATAKQMFAPAQVNVDVSPLEEQIAELKQQIASTNKKKGEIGEMLENMKNIKELMGLMGAQPQGKAGSGLGGALGSLVEKIVNDPEPIAMAVERVLNATAGMKAAATTGRAPAPAQPAAQRDPLPPQIRKTSETLLTAEGDAAIVAAGFEWVTALGNVPQTKKLAERIMALLRGEKANELAIYLRQIFTHFGMGDAASVGKVQEIAQTLVAQVQAANANNEEEADEEGDEEDGQPDLTVRVGGARTEEDAEESDEDDESDDDSDDDEEVDEDDEEVEASDDDDEEEESHDSEPVVEQIVNAAPVEPAPPKRGRGRPRKQVKLTAAGTNESQPPNGEEIDPLLIGAVG